QFVHRHLVEEVRLLLEELQLSPQTLKLEITESTVMGDPAAAVKMLEEIKSLGISLAIDDFGTGYSSLSYLHRFPLHTLKIDRSFLQGIAAKGHSITLLCSVARLIAGLGMSVTMEGIETEEQLALILREESIEEAQGFLFSR